MRRSWIYIVICALLLTLVNADIASAKKSRSKKSSRSQSKRESRRGRTASKRGKNDRRDVAVRGKRGRRLARSRGRGRRRSDYQPVISSGTSRPAPGIPPERITEIQNALIKAGYMDGPATGMYDDDTINAMKDFQAKNGMSQTGLPSAPLLKKLGVPKRSNDGYAVPVNTVSEHEKKHSGSEKPEF